MMTLFSLMIDCAAIASVYGPATNKYIHTFWMSNGSVKIKVRENSKPNTISLITSLEEIFPDNELLTKFNKSLGSSKFYIIALFINR